MKPEAWDARVAAHPLGHLFQTSRWGALKASFGWRWEIVTAGEGGALVLYRRLPSGLFTLAYVPRGPVTRLEEAAGVMAAVERAARRRRALALWVEPNVLDTSEARAQMAHLGFAAAHRHIQPPRTILVDITPPEETILARMKSKTRYNIRLAARRGVRVREGGLDDLPAFYTMMVETGARDGFGVRSEAYFRRLLSLYPAEMLALLIAEVDGEPVAGLIVAALGRTAWYLYGASSSRHRNRMPTYALQWAAIRWARARGCAVYDLWGIPDVDEATLEAEFTERRGGLWGVYRFKRGFGGRVVRYLGMWEKPLSFLYPLAKLWLR